MRLLIASDLHGSPEAAAFLRRRCEELLPDMLVLLGDYLYHGPRNPLPSSYGPPSVVSVFADFETPIVAVRGNCDAEVDLMLLPFAVEDSAVIAADGLRIVAQHGHHLPSCPPIPGVRPGDVVLSGHTHIPRGEPSTASISGTPAAQRCPRAAFRLLMASSKPVRSVCSGLTGGFFWSIGLPQPNVFGGRRPECGTPFCIALRFRNFRNNAVFQPIPSLGAVPDVYFSA